MFTRFLPSLIGAILATPLLGVTPKAPQSPLPNIETAKPVAVGVSAQSELDLPEHSVVKSSSIEKTLPEQTISEQLAEKKASHHSQMAQRTNAQNVLKQKNITSKVSNQKLEKPADEKRTPIAPALGNVTTEVESDLTIVTARLNTSPEWKDVKIEEHGTFLQIKMPGIHIPSSGEFFDGNGPFLKKLATFQVSDSDGALRLFVNQDAAKAKLASSAELLGDRIVITIDHKKLEQLIAPTQKSAVESPSASEIIAKTSVEKDQIAPGDLVAAAGTTGPSEANAKSTQPTQELYGQLTKVAGFCAVMFALFVIAQTIRTKRRRSASAKSNLDSIEPATMKILSTINLGQKQRLTLVQVGSQQILLGVGPESINMLTAIESKPKSTNFATQLQMANPNAEIRLKSPDEIPSSKPMRRTLPTSSSTSANFKNGASTTKSINVAIDDEGPRTVATKPAKKDEDITRMLRDRLRNLPPG